MRVARLALLVLAALCTIAAGDPPTVDEYWRLVDDTSALVRQARSLPSAQRTAQLAQAAEQLEPITAVMVADGQIVPVDNTLLVAALRAEGPDLDQLEARLEALAQARRAWRTAQADPAALDKLAGVLARAEFRSPAEKPPTPFDEWLEEFSRWLDRWLSRLLFADEARVLGIDWVVLIAGGLVLAGVAFFFWRNVRAHMVREAALAQETAESNGLSAATAAKQARALAANANYRQAVRYLYLTALLTLDERGVLRYDKALTNREVLRRAEQAAGSPLAQAMSPVVDTFDQVWYGFAPVDDEAYRASMTGAC